ncbi:putative aldolase LsrF [Anaerotignum neopropionicum]|uniref:Putative aldolase LsrF n=1 Tax=Anaerotignum neopropionicum TaxID=36847 RepID=A0A136WIJ7_9FIRM|nr:3-hydroxy-5-phosphonooxypentane-2,4-dione thiolase [Anaerotignum neopropionicum]KXL54253.1 putative aldolase LsrF [Anaerotignum neopropionicum]KXL54378.1 putative aldolase LsrF [Anaerotignum neopropionicum]
MADKDGNRIAKDYQTNVEFGRKGGFHVKGMDDVDWGMKTRLSTIFQKESGNTVMLAFDHGYFMGSTAGLERMDLSMPPLIPYVDVLMATRGALRSCIPPDFKKGIALRCSAGSSMIDDDLSHEVIAVNIEDAIRMNASCMAVQTFIGAAGEKESIENLCKTIDAGNRYGIPTLGVVAVGKTMERTPTFFKLATRIVAEMGAQIVKTYYCDDFEEITAACPVPIVVAGGKKIEEKEALTMAFRAMDGGARGLDMGRNIFQSDCPIGMAKAIGAIVHKKATIEEAYEIYREEKSRK